MDVVVALFRLAVAGLALLGTKEIWLEGDLHGLVFFTNQANLMLVVVLVWGAAASLGRVGIGALARVGDPPAWLKGAVVLFLGITALVSHFVLAPEDPDAPALFLGLTSGQIEHQITPVAALADFVLLDAHRRLRWRTPALWLLYLIAYAVFTTIRGAVLATPHYPYGFLDLAELGWGGLLLNILIYGVGFYVLGMVLVVVDRVLPVRALIGTAEARGSGGSGRSDGSGGSDGSGTDHPESSPAAVP